MLSRDSEDEIWSRFVFELWPQEVTLARWTQPSGPLCLWQCLDCIPSLYQDLKNYGPHFFYLCEIIGKWVSPPSFGGETKEMMLWKGVWSGKRSHCWAQIEFLIPDLFSLDNFLLEPAPSWVWDMFQKKKSESKSESGMLYFLHNMEKVKVEW